MRVLLSAAPGAVGEGQPSPFHAGERAVQRRAGVDGMAARVGRSIHAAVPPAAAQFLAERSWVVVAVVDTAGRPWASVLAGAPGFARALDARTVRVAAAPAVGDPAGAALAGAEFVGLIATDLASRRRMRVNGRAEVAADGALLIHTDQVYANCPKYIQRRTPAAPGGALGDGVSNETARGAPRDAPAARLTPAQRSLVAAADTFFVATTNPGEGADASHRGGMPGFVRVGEAGGRDRLAWGDYAGNAMFNTLGNVAAYPRAGLLFVDFATGGALQLTGHAAVDWAPEHAAAVAGAERVVTFDVEAVVELPGGFPERLGAPEFSPFNPR